MTGLERFVINPKPDALFIVRPQTVDKAYNTTLSSSATPSHSRVSRRESPAETVNRHWLIPAGAGMTGLERFVINPKPDALLIVRPQTVDKAYNTALSSSATASHSRVSRRESPAETVNRHWLIPAGAGMTSLERFVINLKPDALFIVRPQTVDKAYNTALSSSATPSHSRVSRRESPAETVNRHWLIPAVAGMTGLERFVINLKPDALLIVRLFPCRSKPRQ
ncbi:MULTISPECIES: hypothetical protein [unclassified Brenneria]|uniref:hypothetical protein n=1 Tax=unclassified Brenneria TaxID=2634434 RepID=UPI0029C188EC|nr:MULTISPECIES: hypothetical protein [unclassified Brenneria]MDX5626628.1 hypothetical protein [Brenneria sp. L3-3Z]MDX5694022.1 hypothetical protein [Brenneria sp. L4-2C]